MRGNDHAGARFKQALPSGIPPHPADVLLTENRAWKYRQVLARRTGRLAVVVEDCFDPHNATAVLRTCDAVGVQRVHVVTGRNAFKVNTRISQGTERYLDLQVHKRVEDAIQALRRDGFRILVSELGREPVLDLRGVGEVLAQQPVALVFGSESAGVSPSAIEQADGYFLITMAGFTESLNLSVSVAMSLYALRHQALCDDAPGDLSVAEQVRMYERWLRQKKGNQVDAVLSRREQGRNGEELLVFEAEATGGRPT